MLSILIDENFNHQILRGIRLRMENLDFLVAQNVGLEGADDATLLAWAAEKRRIVLTHDRQTVPSFAYERIRSHQFMPGVIVVSDALPVGEAIETLTMYVECGSAEEFENLVTFLP
jgi:predicted nuclease of predicted toxin-antitoxin system